MLHNIAVTLETLAFVYLSYHAGRFFLAKILKAEFSSGGARAAYRILAGYGVYALVGLILAGVHLFTQSALWVVMFVNALTCSSAIADDVAWVAARLKNRNLLKAALKGALPKPRLLHGVIIIWLLANFLIAFVPLTGHDTLDYHYPIVKDIIATHRLTFTPAIGAYTYLPVLGELLYAVPTDAFGETAAPFVFQLIQYSTIILLAVMVYDFVGKRTMRSFLPPLAAIGLLAMMPLQREVLHGGYVDLPSDIFAIASFLIVLDNAFRRYSLREVLCAAFFLGIAASIKYTSLFFLPVDGILLLIGAYRADLPWKKIVGEAALWSIFFLAIVSPWYIKNTLEYHNPLYPMITNPTITSQVNGFMPIPRTIPNMFIFPFYRFGQYFFQSRVSAGDLVILGYFSAMCLLIALLLIAARRVNATTVTLFITIEAYMSYIFFTSHLIRFMLLALILLPIILGLLVDKTLDIIEERGYFKSRGAKRVFYGIASLACIALLLGNIHYFKIKNYYLIGKYSASDYRIAIGGQ